MDGYKYVVTVGAKFIEELIEILVDAGHNRSDFRVRYLEDGRAELWCTEEFV